jgi:hypothetical protein
MDDPRLKTTYSPGAVMIDMPIAFNSAWASENFKRHAGRLGQYDDCCPLALASPVPALASEHQEA